MIPNSRNIIWDWKLNYDCERKQPQEYCGGHSIWLAQNP